MKHTTHYIIQIQKVDGGTELLRKPITGDEYGEDYWVDYHETYYTDSCSFPDNLSATVINVFTTKEEEDD